MHNTVSTVSVPDSVPHSGPPRVRRSGAAPWRQPTPVRGAGLLACFDSLAAVAAIIAVLISVSLPQMHGSVDDFLSARVTVKNVLLLILLATTWPLIFRMCGLYDARRVQRLESELGRLLAAVTLGCGLALVFPLTSVSGTVVIGHLRHFWVVALGLSLAVRLTRRGIGRARRRHARRALIVGTGRLARRVSRDIRASHPYRYEIVGFVDEPLNGGPPHERVQDEPIGSLDQLEEILMRHVIDEVIIALPVKSRYHQIQDAISVCERAGVEAKYGADLFESSVAFPRYDADGERAYVAMQVAPDGYGLIVKRAIDIVGAAGGLVLLAPVMLVVALGVKLTSRGQIIYIQNRCGYNKRPLRMYKFRTMYANADKQQAALEERNEATGPVFKIRNDPRITPLGRMLRKSSIDELPQLWNVLRGDMSLVGPRPLPFRDVQRFNRPSDMRRFSMRPGITCLWQVQGRSNIGFHRWVELDLEYIDNWSLALDLRILVKTLPAVLSGNGAS